MLYKRYINPMELINIMIRSGRLYNFIGEFIQIENEELKERTLWEYWLHKVFDQSYADFIAQTANDRTGAPDPEELENAVKNSIGIINNFSPE